MKAADDRRLVLMFCFFSCLFSLLLFMKCYFPLKHGLEGYASQESVPQDPGSELNEIPKAIYRRLVLMVIDALRADFVLRDPPLMPFTRQLLRERHGVLFLAKIQPPTVTLPRIKAITTGSIPGFVDVVMNFGSPVLADDNIVTQMKRAGKTVTFFGDDTWLKLFPDHFTRSDGTTSFFVTDYTEVDTNITRHLTAELVADDWETMILHYLGLDHIGHMSGPQSPLVPPKLREMDTVVQQIYSAMESWNGENKASIFVICGDHGMSDQGGHGGASLGEIIVPIIMLSPHVVFQSYKSRQDTNHNGVKNELVYQELQQIDLCPTLAVLLGLPFPQNNLGLLEVSALPEKVAIRQKVKFLDLNAAQVVHLLEKNVADLEKDHAYIQYKATVRDHEAWLGLENVTAREEWETLGMRLVAAYQETIQRMSNHIAHLSTHYDMYGIIIAIVLLWMILGILLLVRRDRVIFPSTHGDWVSTAGLLGAVGAILAHVTLCTSVYKSETLCTWSPTGIILQTLILADLLLAFFLLVHLFARDLQSSRKPHAVGLNWVEVCLIGSRLVQALSLMSSSFVEEEHQSWYFLTTSLHVFLLFTHLTASFTFKGTSPTGSIHPSVTDHICQNEFRGQEAGHDPHAADTWRDCTIAQHSRTTVENAENNSEFTEIRDCSRSNKFRRYKKSSNFSQHSVNASWKEQVKRAASLLAILFVLRVLRRWNQTGNKWLEIPDIGDWLVRPNNKQELSLIVVASLLTLFFSRLSHLRSWISRACFAGSLMAAYCSKSGAGTVLLPFFLSEAVSYHWVAVLKLTPELAFFNLLVSPSFLCHTLDRKSSAGTSSPQVPLSGILYLFICAAALKTFKFYLKIHLFKKGIFEARLSYLFILILCLKELWQSRTPVILKGTRLLYSDHHKVVATDRFYILLEALQVAWLSLMSLLLQPHNVPLIAMLSLIENVTGMSVVPMVRLKPKYLLLYCLAMGQATFFFQGNSNSLSTVDVSAGYIALEQYQPVLIGIQICISTYSGFIFWLLTCLKYINLSSQSCWTCLLCAFEDLAHMTMLTCAMPLALYTVTATVQRHHLFVWTVFSPKLLYMFTQTVVMFVFAGACLLGGCVLKGSRN